MQDILYDEYAEEAPPSGIKRLLAIYAKWGGAVLSLLVLVAFIFWAYRLGQRDASDIPVIRAMDGPVRVQPVDPGGTVVGNQGLEVNEILAGDPAGQPERISIAPATLPLRREDTPVAPDQGPTGDENAASEPETLPDPEAGEVAEVQDDASDTADSEISALIQQANEEDALSQADPAFIENAEIDVIDTGINADLRPLVRPRNFTPAQAAPAPEDGAAPEQVAAANAFDPASLAPGTRLVQLGAFDSSDLAEGQWNLLQRAHADLLGDKTQFVQRAEQNGRTFYRLRVVGFDDRNAQRAMCEALRARDVDCIPVTVR